MKDFVTLTVKFNASAMAEDLAAKLERLGRTLEEAARSEDSEIAELAKDYFAAAERLRNEFPPEDPKGRLIDVTA